MKHIKKQLPSFPPEFAAINAPAKPAAPPAPQPIDLIGGFAPAPSLVKLAENAAIAKSKLAIHKVFMLAVLAGAYIAVGGQCATAVARGMPTTDGGLGKFYGGAVFPVGLMLVIFCGAELVTGNFSVFIPALLKGTVKWYQMALNWCVVWIGNFIGSLMVAYFLSFLTDFYIKDPWLAGVQAVAEAKTSMGWGQVVLSGIGCNWLVCLAVWMALGARTFTCKVLVIWWPIQTFVTIGFDHCVANMYLIPLGMMYGANVTAGDLFAWNLIPATIGNIIGGGLFVGCYYWYLYSRTVDLTDNKDVELDAEKQKDDESD